MNFSGERYTCAVVWTVHRTVRGASHVVVSCGETPAAVGMAAATLAHVGAVGGESVAWSHARAMSGADSRGRIAVECEELWR
jgi:hypothetical protein